MVEKIIVGLVMVIFEFLVKHLWKYEIVIKGYWLVIALFVSLVFYSLFFLK